MVNTKRERVLVLTPLLSSRFWDPSSFNASPSLPQITCGYLNQERPCFPAGMSEDEFPIESMFDILVWFKPIIYWIDTCKWLGQSALTTVFPPSYLNLCDPLKSAFQPVGDHLWILNHDDIVFNVSCENACVKRNTLITLIFKNEMGSYQIGLKLPSWFCALHVNSFNLKSYNCQN